MLAGCEGTHGLVLDPLDLSTATDGPLLATDDLAGRDLTGIDLTRAVPADLAGVDLAGAPDMVQPPQWQTMSSGTMVDLYGVWGPTSDQLYAVGGRPGVTTGNPGVIVHGDGIGWTVGSNLVNLFSVSGSSKFAAAAVGEYGGEGSLTNRGGGGWSSRSVLAAGTLTSIWATRFAEHYIVTSNGAILQSLNGGGMWTTLNTGNSTALNGVWGSSAMDIYAVGASGKIMHSTNGGMNRGTPSSGTSVTLYGVWGASANDVYVAGAGGSGAALLRSTDGGTNWNPATLPVPSTGLFAVWARARATSTPSERTVSFSTRRETTSGPPRSAEPTTSCARSGVSPTAISTPSEKWEPSCGRKQVAGRRWRAAGSRARRRTPAVRTRQRLRAATGRRIAAG